MTNFFNWWFAESWKLPHGFILLLIYLAIIRTIILRFVDIDSMMLDGIVFPIFLTITMIGPEIRRINSGE